MERLSTPKEDRSKLFAWIPQDLHLYLKQDALNKEMSLTLLITTIFQDYKGAKCHDVQGNR